MESLQKLEKAHGHTTSGTKPVLVDGRRFWLTWGWSLLGLLRNSWIFHVWWCEVWLHSRGAHMMIYGSNRSKANQQSLEWSQKTSGNQQTQAKINEIFINCFHIPGLFHNKCVPRSPMLKGLIYTKTLAIIFTRLTKFTSIICK